MFLYHSKFLFLFNSCTGVISYYVSVSFPGTRSWDEGVIGMQLGEIAKIHCSPDYAYGAGGFPAWGIMPNSELVFEIEVLSFK